MTSALAWRDQAKATCREIEGLSGSQEETDAKLILLCVNATEKGATSVMVHYPDTYVFALAIRRYPNLCKDTRFVTRVQEK